ncbi:MAG: DUF1987 family protein [Salinivirgaceae bacterium]|nr:DUF1987 family protein [Salinivirgaceae bacterium]
MNIFLVNLFQDYTGSLLSTDSLGFFEGLFNMANDYIKSQPNKTLLKFNIEYFNTSSSKLLLNLLIQFEELLTMGKDVYLEWHYEEDDFDMYDAGKTYEASIKIPTQLIAFES